MSARPEPPEPTRLLADPATSEEVRALLSAARPTTAPAGQEAAALDAFVRGLPGPAGESPPGPAGEAGPGGPGALGTTGAGGSAGIGGGWALGLGLAVGLAGLGLWLGVRTSGFSTVLPGEAAAPSGPQVPGEDALAPVPPARVHPAQLTPARTAPARTAGGAADAWVVAHPHQPKGLREDGSPRASASRHPGGAARGAPRRDAPDTTGLEAEQRLIEQARRSLASDPAETLSTLERHEVRFADGQLAAERDFLVVRALRRLGRDGEADARSAKFLVAYPESPYARLLRVDR
jgi:hypothetical protein